MKNGNKKIRKKETVRMKYYAVKVGVSPGIYETWEECSMNVHGFSGATYKSFKNIDEAKVYMGYNDNEKATDKPKKAKKSTCKVDKSVDKVDNFEGNVDNSIDDDLSVSEINHEIEERIKNLPGDNVIAFVDGSFADDVDGKARFGYGGVLITGGTITRIYGSFDNDDYLSARNVAGELEGVKQAIDWAIENKKKAITIYYDYEGIEKWAKDEWQAKKPVSKSYKLFIIAKSIKIKIDFVKVKAHTDIFYNEEADRLAKKSLTMYRELDFV